MRALSAMIILGAMLWQSSGSALAQPAAQSFAPRAIEVFQGEIVELKVSGFGLEAVEGRLGREKIYFYPNGNKSHAALVGVDLEAKAAVVNIIIKGTTLAGAHKDMQIPLKIKQKSFQEESFSVAAEFDDLGPDVLERIRREQEQFDRVFASVGSQRLWELPFMLPVSTSITSPFGYRRVINGIPRSPHTGVDLKAPLGTELVASNHGRVALLGDFFFSGKSIILDHGGGLHTVYFHLSEFKVEEGVEVRRGDVIGLSGMTGRVTGPHLHWGARVNRARVDPFELINKLGGTGETSAGSGAKLRKKEE